VVLGVVALIVIALGCLPKWMIERLTGAMEMTAH
jgi:hypothetical protein